MKNYEYLKFDGEYLNGQRNGKGKEYYEGNLKFEGEYLIGKRNGKGKEYDIDGKITLWLLQVQGSSHLNIDM